MNTLEYLFSDEEKIKVLENIGYEIKEGTVEISHHEYHDRVVYQDVKVKKVYDEGIELSFNFQNVINFTMAQVNEIFYEHLKESLWELMAKSKNILI